MPATNFDAHERELLLGAVEDKIHILESKRCDARSNKKKKETWEKVVQDINSLGRGKPKTWLQAKTLWENMKKKGKVENRRRLSALTETGNNGSVPELDFLSLRKALLRALYRRMRLILSVAKARLTMLDPCFVKLLDRDGLTQLLLPSCQPHEATG